MAKEKLPELVEITDRKDIRKFGLEQYTSLIIKPVYVGGRFATEEDRRQALSLARAEADGATHFMAASGGPGVKGFIIYAFVLYGPTKP